MALTRDREETICARAERDPKCRRECLREGVECMLGGDAKIILRDYINATVGFAEVAEHTHIPSNSLMRTDGPAGNRRADNLQQREGIRFLVRTPVQTMYSRDRTAP
jgi:hypothetical protein